MKKTKSLSPVSQVSKGGELKINPALQGKYDDQPLFAEKLKRANELLAKAGVPKFE